MLILFTLIATTPSPQCRDAESAWHRETIAALVQNPFYVHAKRALGEPTACLGAKQKLIFTFKKGASLHIVSSDAEYSQQTLNVGETSLGADAALALLKQMDMFMAAPEGCVDWSSSTSEATLQTFNGPSCNCKAKVMKQKARISALSFSMAC